jgi:hypothetical protein
MIDVALLGDDWGCDLLLEVKRVNVLSNMYSFNPKSMTIAFIRTLNIPRMNILRHNALG